MKSTTEQLTQLFLFSFDQNRFWALKQMGIGPSQLKEVKGLRFYKFLGTGAGNGFSLRPDFSTYALLLVWDSPAMAASFLQHQTYLDYYQRSTKVRCLTLRNFQSHGKWSGSNPFLSIGGTVEKDQTVAIITRATLRFSRLFSFWRHVPQAAKAIETAAGVQYFKGIGEWPFIQQATISIWNSLDDVMQFAYRHKAHASIVKKTRQKKWYAEDLFARFIIQNDTQLKA
ncbi:MAG: hypothetical protein ACPG8F_02995 [Flavobacteriaceae bacterium]